MSSSKQTLCLTAVLNVQRIQARSAQMLSKCAQVERGPRSPNAFANPDGLNVQQLQ